MNKDTITRLQSRADTKANWEKANPVLLENEIGYEKDTGRYKMGDNKETQWNDLPYYINIGNSDGEKSIILNDENNQAIGPYSLAKGYNTQAGMKGYYYSSIDKNIDTNYNGKYKIVLDTVRMGVNTTNIVDYWAIGNIISFVYGTKYMNCATITELINDTIYIDIIPDDLVNKLPIINNESINNLDVDDYSIWVADTGIGLVPLGHYASAEGIGTIALERASHAEGRDTRAEGQYSHAEGRGTTAYYASHAEGYKTEAKGFYSHSEAFQTKSTGAYSHAEGRDTQAKGEASHAEGWGTTANGNHSHSEGTNTKAEGSHSHAEGYNTQALEQGAHSEGYQTYAVAQAAHSEGYSTSAVGPYSHSEGVNTTAEDAAGHAEGDSSYAWGRAAHAEGNHTQTKGDASHAEGHYTTAEGLNAHAEGRQTIASGAYGAHAEGFSARASGEASHAENRATQAIGNYSHAEGESAQSHGIGSHAEGYITRAYGNYSHTEGVGTYAYGDGGHTQGRYNLIDNNGKYAHIVGNGKPDTKDENGKTIKSNRSNAHTLDWNGNAWFAGDVTVGENKDKLITQSKAQIEAAKVNNQILQLKEILNQIQYYEKSNIIPTPSNYFRFEINDDDTTATIYFNGERDLYNEFIYEGEVIIPYSYTDVLNEKTYLITKIGNRAFAQAPNITKITMPNSIKIIGEECFDVCFSLKDISLSTQLQRIENGAFSGCGSLKTINFPSSLTFIGDNAFSTTFLTTIFYDGDEISWKKITIGSDQEKSFFDNSIIFYNNSQINKEYVDTNLNRINTDLNSCKYYGRANIIPTQIFNDNGLKEGFEFNIATNQLVITSSNTDENLIENLIIPYSYLDKKTNKIYEIKSVNISNAITIKNCILPNSVQSLEFSDVTIDNITIPISVLSIKFIDNEEQKKTIINNIYYNGSEIEWNKIAIQQYYNQLSTTNIYYQLININQEQVNTIKKIDKQMTNEYYYSNYYLDERNDLASAEFYTIMVAPDINGHGWEGVIEISQNNTKSYLIIPYILPEIWRVFEPDRLTGFQVQGPASTINKIIIPRGLKYFDYNKQVLVSNEQLKNVFPNLKTIIRIDEDGIIEKTTFDE